MSYRLSIYPEGKLGAHAEIFPGYAFESERFTNNPNDVPLVKGENVQQGYIDWAASRFWPANDVHSLEKFILRPGDIVLAMDRPWVTAGLKWAAIKPHDPQSLLVQRVARLRAKPTLDQGYLRCLISSSYFSSYIQPIVTGVNVPHISGKQIGDFRIPVPDLPTQRKIAAVLAAYDDLIEANRRRIALLERMAEEIYREWFVRLRFPGHATTQITKGLPAGWRVAPLAEIAKITMGQSPPSEFYNEIGDGLPFHQGVGTYGERFPVHSVFCSETGRVAEEGDVLFSVRAPVGRLNLADRKLIIGRGLSAIRHHKHQQSYLFYKLRLTFSKEDVIGNGSIFAAVGKDELLKFQSIEPSDNLIAQFEEIAAPLDRSIATLTKTNAHLTHTRDLLLPRLISGKLPVESLPIAFPPSMAVETAL